MQSNQINGFSKDFIIEVIQETIAEIVSMTGVNPNTKRSECSDFEDAYHVGQIHSLIALIGIFTLAPDSENQYKDLEEVKREVEIYLAQQEAKGETKQ